MQFKVYAFDRRGGRLASAEPAGRAPIGHAEIMNEKHRVARQRDRRRGSHPRRSVRSGEGAETRHCVEELARIGFTRALENVESRALLHHPPRPHHRHPVGHLCDDAHIVSDQQDSRAEIGAELPHELEDLSLDGDIERGGRLVGDQHLGRHDNAIAIITRCLMPPDSSCGYWPMRRPGSVICTASSIARARASALSGRRRRACE